MSYKTTKRKLQRKQQLKRIKARKRFLKVQRQIAFEEWEDKNISRIVKEYMEGVQ